MLVDIRYKLFNEGTAPKRMSLGDIGYDLCANKAHRFDRGEDAKIPLGVGFHIPEGYYAELTHRSSLAFKKGMICSLGILDSSYRSEYQAYIFNISGTWQKIERGDRICQVIFKKKVETVMLMTDDIGEGKEGFGSSGGYKNDR